MTARHSRPGLLSRARALQHHDYLEHAAREEQLALDMAQARGVPPPLPPRAEVPREQLSPGEAAVLRRPTTDQTREWGESVFD